MFTSLFWKTADKFDFKISNWQELNLQVPHNFVNFEDFEDFMAQLYKI